MSQQEEIDAESAHSISKLYLETAIERIIQYPEQFDLKTVPDPVLVAFRFDERNEPVSALKDVAMALLRHACQLKGETVEDPEMNMEMILRFGALCEIERYRRMQVIDYVLRDCFAKRPYIFAMKGPCYTSFFNTSKE